MLKKKEKETSFIVSECVVCNDNRDKFTINSIKREQNTAISIKTAHTHTHVTFG